LSLILFRFAFLHLVMAAKNQPEPLNLGNQANEELIAMLNNAFAVSFDEGLMEDPSAKSPFNYNGKPVVSQSNDSDLGEILSSVLNIFRDAADVKFSFIADELAERLNLTMFELFKNKFVTRPGKFSPFYFENVAVFPKQPEAGNLNKFIEDTTFSFLFDIRGY
jgi:hypothetical protein